MALKEYGGEIIPIEGRSPELKPYEGEIVPVGQEKPKPSPLRRLADIPVALAKGVVGAGEAAVGLADLATGGQAGKALHDATGYDPKATKELLDEQYSPQQKAAKAEVDQATGFTGKAKAMLQNPSTIGEAVVESAPLMLGGGAAAQGLGKATKLGAVARSALGEGVVGAGSAAEGIRQETPDGTLDAKQTAAAIGTGAGTAAITAASGGIARKLGISDLDTQLATRGGVAEGLANTSAKGRARRLAEGALTEGVLEEMPQSGLEQGLQNVALDKPIGEGVPEAMAAGMLTGAAMGGPLAAAPATAKNSKPLAQPPTAETQPPEAAPPPPAPILDAQAMERAGVMPPPVLDDQQISRKVDLSGVPDDQGQAGAAAGEPAPTDLRQTIEDTTGISGRAAPGGSRLKDLKAAFDEQIEPQVIIDDSGKVTTTTNKLEFQQFQADYENRVALRQRNIEAGRRLHAAKAGINPDDGPLSAGAAIALELAASGQQDQSPAAEGEAPTPTPSPQAAPTGSFGAMNDFADLLDQERQDVTQRRASIAERQGQRRAFDLAEADRRTAESMQREAQARRRAVLDAVLADPETKNPAGRFAATLRREGYRDSAPTEDELRTIQRFEDVRAAKPAPPEVEPSAPNELDPAAMGIRERRAPAPPKNLREGMARAQAARAAEGGSMPQAAQPTAAPSFDPGKAWASLDTKQRADLAGSLQGVPPIVSKNVPRAEWGKINPALRAKLAEAMQPRAAGQEALDAAAHEAATSPRNDRPQPTEAQAKAGNYKKGHVSVGGLDIAIENPEGSTRSGIDPGGKPWSVTMTAHYGYVKRTQGADGDQVDVYLGKADPVAGPVFVVDQFDNRTGKFDEHKAILGASSLKEAQALYDAHFSDGKGPERRGAITSMSFDAFKDWAKNGNTAEPLGQREGADKNQDTIKSEPRADAGPATENVPANQEPAQAQPAQPAVIDEAPSPLEALFAGLDSASKRKANKTRKTVAGQPQADRINYVQANFHDLLIQAMDAGSLEVNGVANLTEENQSCL